MAEHDEEELLRWVEDLQQENKEYKAQVFIAESVVGEFRQALADTQLALAKSNAQLKLAQQGE